MSLFCVSSSYLMKDTQEIKYCIISFVLFCPKCFDSGDINARAHLALASRIDEPVLKRIIQ